MDSVAINGVAPAGRAGSRPVLDPGGLLTAGAVLAAGLSMVSLWWAVPTGVVAFLAGRRPGPTGATVLE
ncbi:hypothetical protein [Streptomyces sp. NPDC050988]|uniref:hypothetical protein n=1 Tax=Streptomyces sp. NPDC050988 TaxID=3365637 RepID=UPI0037893499